MPTSLEYVYPRVCMLAYCIIINTPSKHSKSRNWAIALAALHVSILLYAYRRTRVGEVWTSMYSITMIGIHTPVV